MTSNRHQTSNGWTPSNYNQPSQLSEYFESNPQMQDLRPMPQTTRHGLRDKSSHTSGWPSHLEVATGIIQGPDAYSAFSASPIPKILRPNSNYTIFGEQVPRAYSNGSPKKPKGSGAVSCGLSSNRLVSIHGSVSPHFKSYEPQLSQLKDNYTTYDLPANSQYYKPNVSGSSSISFTVAESISEPPPLHHPTSLRNYVYSNSLISLNTFPKQPNSKVYKDLSARPKDIPLKKRSLSSKSTRNTPNATPQVSRNMQSHIQSINPNDNAIEPSLRRRIGNIIGLQEKNYTITNVTKVSRSSSTGSTKTEHTKPLCYPDSTTPVLAFPSAERIISKYARRPRSSSNPTSSYREYVENKIKYGLPTQPDAYHPQLAVISASSPIATIVSASDCSSNQIVAPRQCQTYQVASKPSKAVRAASTSATYGYQESRCIPIPRSASVPASNIIPDSDDYYDYNWHEASALNTLRNSISRASFSNQSQITGAFQKQVERNLTPENMDYILHHPIFQRIVGFLVLTTFGKIILSQLEAVSWTMLSCLRSGLFLMVVLFFVLRIYIIDSQANKGKLQTKQNSMVRYKKPIKSETSDRSKSQAKWKMNFKFRR